MPRKAMAINVGELYEVRCPRPDRQQKTVRVVAVFEGQTCPLVEVEAINPANGQIGSKVMTAKSFRCGYRPKVAGLQPSPPVDLSEERQKRWEQLVDKFNLTEVKLSNMQHDIKAILERLDAIQAQWG